jgi:hypothetical protein
MQIHISRMAATAASILALSAGAALAQSQAAAETPRESTAFTLATDQPRTAEQLAMQFDKADLSIKVIPDDRAIDAVAVLDFTALAPLDRLVVELDTLLTISSVQVDGVEVASDRWTNPEGRLTVDLPQTLPTGGKTALRIAYAGQPRVAPRPASRGSPRRFRARAATCSGPASTAPTANLAGSICTSPRRPACRRRPTDGSWANRTTATAGPPGTGPPNSPTPTPSP